ncbi:MAG: hypothetical protein V4714_00340 [Bacteroidota bacterium]
MKILQIGCLVIVSVFVLFIGFMIAIWVDFSYLSDSQAKEIIESPRFKVIELYILSNKKFDYMVFCGVNEPSEKTNIWQVNEYLIDFQHDEIIEITEGGYYFSKKDLQSTYNPTTLTLKEFYTKNKPEYDSLNITLLREVSKNAMEFEFISISKIDKLDLIKYCLKNNSPLSKGYGILYSSDTTILHSKRHDEIQFLSSKHYKYQDGVE